MLDTGPPTARNERNETTRSGISQGMLALMENPNELERLYRDPSLVPTAVEEILQWASPVMFFRRNVTRDIELGGQHIREGDKVSLWYISANRDESIFDHPFRFDIRRNPNPHIAFGGGGPHFCLGAQLARLEIRLLFEELATRVPVLDSPPRPDRLRSNFIAGIKHLPIRMTLS